MGSEAHPDHARQDTRDRIIAVDALNSDKVHSPDSEQGGLAKNGCWGNLPESVGQVERALTVAVWINFAGSPILFSSLIERLAGAFKPVPHVGACLQLAFIQGQFTRG